jgi:hypothetical protein
VRVRQQVRHKYDETTARAAAENLLTLSAMNTIPVAARAARTVRRGQRNTSRLTSAPPRSAALPRSYRVGVALGVAAGVAAAEGLGVVAGPDAVVRAEPFAGEAGATAGLVGTRTSM